MMPKRPTLADRKRAAREALAAGTETAPPTPSTATAPSTTSAPDPSSATTATGSPDATNASSAASAASRGGTISVSLTTQQYRDAQAAFLADWEHGGPDTFTAWIETALRTHAVRTSSDRAALAATASGSTRSFRITEHTRELIDTAITDDFAAGYWTSISAWAATAITAATQHARTRGPLPAPPTRLPGRLPRKAPR
jgi:hypothetical protein